MYFHTLNNINDSHLNSNDHCQIKEMRLNKFLLTYKSVIYIILFGSCRYKRIPSRLMLLYNGVMQYFVSQSFRV